MQITTTFRQMEASEALREYAEEKIGRLERFADGIREAHCVMKAQRETHSVEITLLVRKKTLRAAESSENMYASIDLATDKLSRQLKRYREKQNESARRTGQSVRHITEEKVPAAAQRTRRGGGPTGGKIRLVSTFNPKPMFVDDAVLQMDQVNDDFYVFLNAESDEVNVIYRLPKGGYGLVEPED